MPAENIFHFKAAGKCNKHNLKAALVILFNGIAEEPALSGCQDHAVVLVTILLPQCCCVAAATAAAATIVVVVKARKN